MLTNEQHVRTFAMQFAMADGVEGQSLGLAAATAAIEDQRYVFGNFKDAILIVGRCEMSNHVTGLVSIGSAGFDSTTVNCASIASRSRWRAAYSSADSGRGRTI